VLNVLSIILDNINGATSDFLFDMLKSLFHLIPIIIFSEAQVEIILSMHEALYSLLNEYCASSDREIVYMLIKCILLQYRINDDVIERFRNTSCSLKETSKKLIKLSHQSTRISEAFVTEIIVIWTKCPTLLLEMVSEFCDLSILLKKDPSALDEHFPLVLKESIAISNEESKAKQFPEHRLVVRCCMLAYLDSLLSGSKSSKTEDRKILYKFYFALVSESMVRIENLSKETLVSFSESYEFSLLYFNWQNLSLLLPVFDQADYKNEKLTVDLDLFLRSHIQRGVTSQIRQVIESVACLFYIKRFDLFVNNFVHFCSSSSSNLLNLRPAVQVSFLVILTFTLIEKIKHSDMSCVGMISRAIEIVLSCLHYEMTNNIGYVRTTSQFLFRKLMDCVLVDSETGSSFNIDPKFISESFKGMQGYISTYKMQLSDSDLLHVTKKIGAIYEAFIPKTICSLNGIKLMNANHDLIFSFPIAEKARNSISAVLSELRNAETVISDPFVSPHKSISTANFQQKIIPLETLYQNFVSEEFEKHRDFVQNASFKTAKQPLIVFASLLTKAPNLGGLARTCEVFQASKMTIPDKKFLNEKQFLSVSVASENWVTFEEIKPPKEYIENESKSLIPNSAIDYSEILSKFKFWKDRGYRIVALEQSSTSVSLEKYEFPDKIVLVLGREKEGVPIEILDQVDDTIEIPQFGLVRSLNVHVSGALCIWEYTRQRLARGTLK
jgi:tRNA G18 (ribose-2'-O)-methylase SpoU